MSDETRTRWQLRPISQADFEWAFALHRDALGEYVERTWGWDEEVQRRMFASSFARRPRQVIERGGGWQGALRTIEYRGRTSRGSARSPLETMAVNRKPPTHAACAGISPGSSSGRSQAPGAVRNSPAPNRRSAREGSTGPASHRAYLRGANRSVTGRGERRLRGQLQRDVSGVRGRLRSASP